MMMRRLYLASTIVFWLAVAGFWAAGVLLPDGRESRAVTPGAPASADARFTADEVAAHASRDDCWMIIDAQVYDFTPYVAQHPSDPAVFLPWCGKEASVAYRTKTKGRPHSPYADRLLPTYRDRKSVV